MINKPTVEEFLLAYDDFEGIILSDPEMLDDDLQNLSLNDTSRIQLALDDAYGLVLSYYLKALPTGRAMIKSSSKRDQLQIARYLLDTVKARQPVKEAYEEVLSRLKETSSMEQNIQLTEEEQIELGIKPKQGNKIRFSNGGRVYDRDSLSNFRDGRLFYR